MTKYYRIKKFSNLTSVTVRTLHYYDEISLLPPSHRLKNGRRLYSEDDLLRLQQITTFKFLGFSLLQIQQLLQSPEFNIKKSLKTQAEVLAGKALKIQNAIQLIQQVVNELDNFNKVDWKVVAKIIEVFQTQDKQFETWIQKFLSKSEQDEFDKIFTQFTKQQMKDYGRQWANLFEEVKENINTEPEGAIGQELARKWLSLVNEMYGEHPGLRKKIWDATKVGAISTDYMPYYDQGVINYIDKATCFYKKVNNCS